MIKTFNEFLNEAKQVGILYHFTNIENLLGILKSNKIIGSSGEREIYISFTRNKNFNLSGHYGITGTSVRISINGDKLSNNYKIKPYFYKEFNRDEMEERVITTSIKNISNYIIEIMLYNNILLYNEYQGKQFISQQNILHRFIKKDDIDDPVNLNDILEYLKQYNIKINIDYKN